ncbi:MAG TPA: cyclic nucleotide-binding domain-containing protein [Bosea sp. (in: a-proteobacteria)]|jgi:CRP-like cAMP-binding protein|uniref:cyclic nucleotide-binding domain-containing protein n=1 Tax=Bosea sp. (in: a-proteobacteria) TaxID=1871050 RepID=UPI002E100BE5|nr:cyclic nucleotide-binding domain-containing protein [Bosea sp. (in: a-proteobacteria)]
MTLEADIASLGRLPLFRSLPPPRLKLVALMAEKLHFAAGERIIDEGDKPEGVYVVLQGEVEISHEDPEHRGPRLPLAPGSLIGDVPLLCGQSFVGAVTAKSAVSALRLPKDLFFELLETIPDFSLALSRDLASRLYRLADFTLHGEKVH